MGLIKLKSSDSELFEVDRDVLKNFKVIDEMLDIIGLDETNVDVIPLKKIDSTILGIILKWAETHHQQQRQRQQQPQKQQQVVDSDDEQQLNTTQSTAPSDHLCEFERDFIDKYDELKYDIMNAANFLGAEELANMLIMELAKKCANKSPDRIREIGTTQEMR